MKDSEFRTYGYISEVLSDLGWDKRNPKRGGNVYTQGEFRKHDKLLTNALGREAPENIICIPWDNGFRYWVVEAKANHKDLHKALEEAKAYSDKINASNNLNNGVARFATGIAGSPDDSFLITTCYWNGSIWEEVSINSHNTTGFLTLQQCIDILIADDAKIANFDYDPDKFFKKANAINEALHSNSIAVADRAKLLGALLLALAAEGNLRIFSDATRMVNEINSRIVHILEAHGKGDFASIISLDLPATNKNHDSFRKALVETLQYLREMNVRSAINSGDDALGKFYETFLKYANGAKEMGIVLTPRHVTKFAVDCLGVTWRDKVYDPACGTGGFLVAAMDYVRQSNCTKEEFDRFKNDGLWGVEIEDSVYCLALVNMIFRGDGKSGLNEGSCFDYDFWKRDGKIFSINRRNTVPEGSNRPFSRIFMNPPYKKKDRTEADFVDHALSQCKPGALLFAVLPHLNIGGRDFISWRKEVLKRHSIKAVIKMDKRLFYPVQEGTYGLVIKAHEPHDKYSKVMMACMFDDNSRHRKSKMISAFEAKDNVEILTELLKLFLSGRPLNVNQIPEQMTLAPLNLDDECMYCPEIFIPHKEPEFIPDITNKALGLRMMTAKVKMMSDNAKKQSVPISSLKLFPLTNFVESEISSTIKNIKGYGNGQIPVVSATADNNGISEWKDISEEETVENLISISKTHNTKPCRAYWHPYKFAAINTVILLKPIPEFANCEEALLYLCQEIADRNAWRYDYARTVKLDELEVYLPVQEDGSVDFERIVEEASKQYSTIT